MSISFNSISPTQRLPLVAVEFNSTQAQQGPSILAFSALLIGQKLAAGTAVADTVVKVTSVDDVITKAGRGSMLHRMALAWFASNKSTPLSIGVLADNGAGTAAQGTLTVTVTTAVAGTIALYAGGERITIGVNAGDAQNTIATAIGAAINANLDLPITATVSTNVVTWTFRHKGTAGQGYNLRDSFRDGEALPGGVSIAYAATTAGATNPTLTALIAGMSDLWFHVIGHPYTDATSLAAIEAELASRLGPTRSQDAVAITSTQGSFSTHTTLGGARNSPSSVIMAQPGTTPLTPPMEFAAECAAVITLAAQADPARPFQTLALTRAIAPAEIDQFDISERNLFLFDGISPTRRVPGGGVQLERVITTYQTSSSGADDTAYLDATTLFTLMYLRYSLRQRFLLRFPRHKLAADSTRLGSGQAVVTPKIAKAECCAWFREMEEIGLVEDFDQFKRDLVCERNADPNRLDIAVGPNLINGLAIVAASLQFRL